MSGDFLIGVVVGAGAMTLWLTYCTAKGWICRHPPETVVDDYDDFLLTDDFGGPTVGYCSKCREARDSFYTCRDGGHTVPKEEK